MITDQKVEIIRKSVDLACYTANGFMYCYCGKCKPEDYKLPKDYGNNQAKESN